jgi:hypothetical protein
VTYSCYVISNRPHMIPPILKSVYPENITHFDGSGATSFSKLVNSCIASSTSEIVIIMSDKVLPTSEHIQKTLNLLNEGFAFVSLYRFAFFGFKKELFRTIGLLDERYIGGGFEDDDFYLRMREANLSMYVTEEIQYERLRSSWNIVDANQHFVKKWGDIKKNNYAKRLIPEEQYTYNLGLPVPTTFKTWDQSMIKPVKVKKWSAYPIIREER